MVNSPTFSPWYKAEHVTLLRKWWCEEGLAASKISANFKELGVTITKNAIIGKVHRMNFLPPETKPKAQREMAKQRVSVANMKRAKQPVIRYVLIDGKRYHPNHKENTMIKEVQGSSQSVLLKDSQEGQCKFIVGYVGGKAALAVYCGKATVASNRSGRIVMTSWCADHFARCTTEARR